MTPVVALTVMWVVGLLDQANEYRTIHRCKTASGMTPHRWTMRRRAARASLVATAVTMTLMALATAGPLWPVAAWCFLAAPLWVTADLATPGAPPTAPMTAVETR